MALPLWIGSDLWRDLRSGTCRSERWFPWTASLLTGWLDSGDPAMVRLAEETLSRQPYPYGTAWLRWKLKRNPMLSGKWSSTRLGWLGLDRPEVLQEMTLLAVRAAKADGDFYNECFLNSLAETCPAQSIFWPTLTSAAEKSDSHSASNLMSLYRHRVKFRVLGLETDLPEPLALRVKKLARRLRFGSPYYGLSDEAQARLDQIDQRSVLSGPEVDSLLEELSEKDAADLLFETIPVHEKPDPRGVALVRRVFETKKGRLRIIAALLLTRHGDTQGRRFLQKVELEALSAAHLPDASYVELARLLPDSAYARACREYGAIRGTDYFGYKWAFHTTRDQRYRDVARGPALEKRFQAWLARYPGHPGADDATYWRVRLLEFQGRRLEALDLTARALERNPGDGDMGPALLNRFLWLIDVGTTEAELEDWLGTQRGSPLYRLARYARTVRLARAHRYGEALDARPFEPGDWSSLVDEMHSLRSGREQGLDGWKSPGPQEFEEQRSCWRRAEGLSGLDLARCWAREGDKLGTLLVYSHSWCHFSSMDELQLMDDPGTPDVRVDRELMRRNCQRANPRCVAVDLLRQTERSPESLVLQLRMLDRLWYRAEERELAWLEPLPGGTIAEQARALNKTMLEDYPQSVYSREAYILTMGLDWNLEHVRRIATSYPKTRQAALACQDLEFREGSHPGGPSAADILLRLWKESTSGIGRQQFDATGIPRLYLDQLNRPVKEPNCAKSRRPKPRLISPRFSTTWNGVKP